MEASEKIMPTFPKLMNGTEIPVRGITPVLPSAMTKNWIPIETAIPEER